MLSEVEAVEIIHNLLTSVRCMQKLGIAHRDLKLANIFMGDELGTDSVKVKLGDYGMSDFVGKDGLLRGRCGTPGYVAPEILRAGVKIGYRNNVDMFSTGVVMYTLLCGYEPFYGETDKQLVESNKQAKVDFHEHDWGHISIEAKTLILKMLNPDPDERIKANDALNDVWFKKNGLSNDVEQDSVEVGIGRVEGDTEGPTCSVM
jgi:serine/threonine protein kinase